MSTLLETCRIAPPPGAAADHSLPLTFFDIIWLPFHPIRRLLFYEFPCSNPYFVETLLPELKQSLSLSLKHFFPLAGRIVCYKNPDRKPELRYRAGDSISLTVSESSDDFDHLVGNHPRESDQFYQFIPQMPPMTEDSDEKLHEVLAVQVTLFPGRGVCIGVSNHHSAGDATSMVGFVKFWASIHKIGGEKGDFFTESIPIFDRSVIKYPLELDSIYWNAMQGIPSKIPSFPLPTNRARSTFLFPQSELNKMKNLVQEKIPGLIVSSFVAAAAYVWTCLAKSDADAEDNEPEIFLFAIDLRARISPPVPRNYLGNCLSYGLAEIRHRELVGGEGFALAARAIAEEIKNRVIRKEKVLEGSEDWIAEMGETMKKRVFSVSGSARVDVYGVDFGWGKVRKMEALSIDEEVKTMSLCKSRDFEGGLEVGLSLPAAKMAAFTALFSGGIKAFK